jgi:hypothetical protein
MSDCELLASILEGEAGALGRPGMLLVAATIATRLSRGQSIARIAREYYGRDEPSEDALDIARDIVVEQAIPPNGCEFILSDADVKNETAKGYTVKVIGRYEDAATGLGLNLVREYWR